MKTVKHGDTSTMIQGYPLYYGDGPIYGIPVIMDQYEYLEILEDVMLCYAEEKMTLKLVFQHDNYPKQISNPAASWFPQG